MSVTQPGTHEEVVTFARVQTFDMPAHAGRMALITLDNDLDHTRPSTFGSQGLDQINAALDQIQAMDDVAAIAITGKPFIFAVGADLSAIDTITSHAQAL